MKRIYLAGTADTKSEELAFLATQLRRRYAAVCVVDVGTRDTAFHTDVTASDVAAHHPGGAAAVLGLTDRGQAVSAMGLAFARFIASCEDIAGVIGIGGGGGTSILCHGLRDLSYGLPKLVVTTMASGDTAHYVGISDLILMPAVTDLAGLNRISRTVLHNAAMAMAGMAGHPATAVASKPAIGLTMFGVTTPCVTAIADDLRKTHDCLVFHATGTGGRTMEKLADDGMLTGVIDITTTEVADYLLGGVLPATGDRFGAVARCAIPWVGSVGALDMVNFGAADTVPPQYKGRLLYRHNPQVTLMRTTPDENTLIGQWIAARLNLCSGAVHLLIPEGGISMLDAPGMAFHDPVADQALFAALETHLRPTASRRLTRLPHHINDPAFSAAATAAFREMIRG